MGAFRNQIKNASTYLAPAVAFFIPFGIRPLIYMIALWAFAVVIRGEWIKNWHENMTNSEKRKFFLLFVIFYLINLISLIYSRDQKEGFKEIQVKFSILLIPVLFAVSEKWTEKKVKKLFLAFVAGVIIASFVCYINAMLHSLQWADGKIIFSVHPPKSPWNSYFSYSDFSFMLHPSYFAMYICFVLMLLLDTYSSNKVNIICINKYLSFILLIFLSATLFLLSSRAGILTWFVVLFLFSLRKFIYRNGISDIIYVLFSLVLIAGLFFYVLINENRMKVIRKELETAGKIDDASYPGSVALRLILWQDAWQVIKSHPWVGTGTGSTEKSLYTGKSGGKYTWPEKMQLNVHNQFLETWLENGILALLILLAIIFYPFYKKEIKWRYLLKILSVIILINFSFESMLVRVNGVAFFAFFYCLLILAVPSGRKTIPKKNYETSMIK